MCYWTLRTRSKKQPSDITGTVVMWVYTVCVYIYTYIYIFHIITYCYIYSNEIIENRVTAVRSRGEPSLSTDLFRGATSLHIPVLTQHFQKKKHNDSLVFFVPVFLCWSAGWQSKVEPLLRCLLNSQMKARGVIFVIRILAVHDSQPLLTSI